MDLVVGYDDSSGARRALEVAIELAKPLGDAIVLAYAAAPPGRSVGDEYQAHLAALEERGRELVGDAAQRVAAAGLRAEVEVAAQRPVDLLLELADRRATRMIVVGTYGESPLRGAVLGSTPHKLLHLSRVPLLAVPG